MLYRILTEDKNRSDVEKIVGAYFPGFTLLHGAGYYKGAGEDALVIEIEAHGNHQTEYSIAQLATRIKYANKQQQIIVQRIETDVTVIE